MKRQKWIVGLMAALSVMLAAVGSLCGAIEREAVDPALYGEKSRAAVAQTHGMRDDDAVTTYIGMDAARQHDVAQTIALYMALGGEDTPLAVDELKEIVKLMNGKPFILKGIMTVNGAKKALEAGASGIVVSNHGGRVLDQCPATAEVLPAIVDAVGGKMTILVDGGIRTGMDVFKALALGADAVLIGRPFVNMVYGGGAEGVQVYVDKLKAELADTMAMCGAHKLSDIKRSMIFGY